MFPFQNTTRSATSVQYLSPTMSVPSYFNPFLSRIGEPPHPLDLSLRHHGSCPITPPSTPSPPRKRPRSMDTTNADPARTTASDLWQHHRFALFDDDPNTIAVAPTTSPTSLVHKSTLWAKQYLQSTQQPIRSSRRDSMALSRSFKYLDGSSDTTIDLDADEESQKSIAAINPNPIDLGQSEVVGDDDDAERSDDENSFIDILSQEDTFTRLGTDDEDIDIHVAVPAGPLQRNEMAYEDDRAHSKALAGFAKLFDIDYSALGNHKPDHHSLGASLQCPSAVTTTIAPPPRKKFKLRKHTAADEDHTSPVSGTIIRKLRADEELVVRKGDIDPAFNVVEITDEAKALLADIENEIGSYICQLCRAMYEDAFQLAQHRCSRIVHVEYRCAECDKVSECSASPQSSNVYSIHFYVGF